MRAGGEVGCPQLAATKPSAPAGLRAYEVEQLLTIRREHGRRKAVAPRRQDRIAFCGHLPVVAILVHIHGILGQSNGVDQGTSVWRDSHTFCLSGSKRELL